MNAMLLGLVIVVGAPGAKDPLKKGVDIFGEWVDETIVSETRKIFPTAGAVAGTRQFTKEGQYSLISDGKVVRGGFSAFKIDTTVSPWTIDLIDESVAPTPDPKLWKGIYKIDGDVLTLCMGRPNGDRPTKFESSEKSGEVLWTLKRVKPKD